MNVKAKCTESKVKFSIDLTKIKDSDILIKDGKKYTTIRLITEDTKIIDVDCSTRLFNALKNFGIDIWENKISELSKISVRDFLRCHKSGPSTFIELYELCFCAGVTLQL